MSKKQGAGKVDHTSSSSGGHATQQTCKTSLLEDKNPHLLDEVSGLIEQEKTLLGLKLLEQQREAQLWKTKYDDLIGKVVKDTEGSNADFPALEMIANSIQQTELENKKRVEVKLSADEIFQSLFHNTNADFSKTFIDNGSVNDMVKCLTNRLPTKTIASLSLAKTNVDDKNSEALGHLIAIPKILAFDFSMNRLGLDFFKTLNAALRLRRLSPQYLLLHGNEPLAAQMSTTNYFSEARCATAIGIVSQFIENSVNDSIWGICISLRDFDVTHLRKESPDGDKGGKAGTLTSPTKKSSTKLNPKASKAALYADDSTHPMQILAFLNSICTSITNNRRLTKGRERNASPSKSSKKLADEKSKKVVSAANPTSLATETSITTALKGVSNLCVLGLMYSTISRQSLEKLEETLQLNLASMTDLDIGFSYIGGIGVEVLSKFLKESDHSLIRLGLAGNSLNNNGFASIMRSITHSNTIAFVDMRSNGINDDGLPALSQCLSHNCIISHLNLSDNHEISLSSTVYYSNLVKSNGSSAVITWCDGSITKGVISTSSNTVKQNERSNDQVPVFLYRNPAKQLRPISLASRDALLYTLDLRRFGNNSTSAGGAEGFEGSGSGGTAKSSKTCRLSWSFRPSESKAHIRSNNTNFGFIDIMNSKLSYEVRVLNAKGSIVDSLFRSGSVPMGDCLTPIPSYGVSPDKDGREFSWLMTNVELDDLPDAGTVEIWINVSPSRQLAPKHINKSSKSSSVRISAFECMNCELQMFHNEDTSNGQSFSGARSSTLVAEHSSVGFQWPEMGSSEMFVSFYQNCKNPRNYSDFLHKFHEHVPSEHKVVRVFNWLSSESRGMVSFDIRLNSPSTDSDQSKQTGGIIYGYETCVSVVGIDGSVRLSNCVENIPKGDAKGFDIMSVWNWEERSVRVDNLRPNDLVVVSVAIKLRDSTGAVLYANIPASKCTAIVKSFLLRSQENMESKTGIDSSDKELLQIGSNAHDIYKKVYPPGGSSVLNPENVNFMM